MKVPQHPLQQNGSTPLPPALVPPETSPKQVRDEARATNDPARGGMGGLALAELQGGGGGGGGGGDYYGNGGNGGGGRASKRPRVDWDARDNRW